MGHAGHLKGWANSDWGRSGRPLRARTGPAVVRRAARPGEATRSAETALVRPLIRSSLDAPQLTEIGHWSLPEVSRKENSTIRLQSLRHIHQAAVIIEKPLPERASLALISNRKFLAFSPDPCNSSHMALPRGQAIRRPPQGILRDPLCVSGDCSSLRIHHRSRNTSPPPHRLRA